MSTRIALTVEQLKARGYNVQFAGCNQQGDDTWAALAPDGSDLCGCFDEDEAWQACRDHDETGCAGV